MVRGSMNLIISNITFVFSLLKMLIKSFYIVWDYRAALIILKKMTDLLKLESL